MRRHHETAHNVSRAHFAGFRQDGRRRPPKGPARSPVSLAARQQYKVPGRSPNRPPPTSATAPTTPPNVPVDRADRKGTEPNGHRADGGRAKLRTRSSSPGSGEQFIASQKADIPAFRHREVTTSPATWTATASRCAMPRHGDKPYDRPERTGHQRWTRNRAPKPQPLRTASARPRRAPGRDKATLAKRPNCPRCVSISSASHAP